MLSLLCYTISEAPCCCWVLTTSVKIHTVSGFAVFSFKLCFNWVSSPCLQLESRPAQSPCVSDLPQRVEFSSSSLQPLSAVQANSTLSKGWRQSKRAKDFKLLRCVSEALPQDDGCSKRFGHGSPTTLTGGHSDQQQSHLSLLRLLSSVTRAIIAILYMWSDTLSGLATFLYTHPVRGTRCARRTSQQGKR